MDSTMTDTATKWEYQIIYCKSYKYLLRFISSGNQKLSNLLPNTDFLTFSMMQRYDTIF